MFKSTAAAALIAASAPVLAQDAGGADVQQIAPNNVRQGAIPQIDPRARSRSSRPEKIESELSQGQSAAARADLQAGAVIVTPNNEAIGAIVQLEGDTILVSNGTTTFPIPTSLIRKVGGRLVVGTSR